MAGLAYLPANECISMSERRLRIIVVEDNEPDVFMVREALERADLEFELQVMDDGEKAVNLVEKIDQGEAVPQPDLVLLDLNLPRKSGVQVLERLRKSPRCARTPVVILTSSDSPKDRLHAELLGATQYFQKPSRLQEFMKLGPLVRELLNQYGSSAQAV